MGDELPSEYDIIVIGTGMTESIVAAAASRIGKRVLHLDSNEYYGGLWASFNFEGLQNWIEECRQLGGATCDVPIEQFNSLLKEGESIIKANNQLSTVFNVDEKWYIVNDSSELSEQDTKDTQTDGAKESGEEAKSEEAPAEGATAEEGENAEQAEEHKKTDKRHKSWSQTEVKKNYRKFNIDLAPKLLFARGSLVELLISSNIARYAEFRSVSRVVTWLQEEGEGRLEPVPCSRADVFATRNVSVVEKRMLMKLLTSCMERENHPEEFEEFETKTFLEFLKAKKLTPNLIHYVLYAICMGTDSTSFNDGLVRTHRFLYSLGRYGNTPFLWPMYGSGELPQCFCRLCAVFGGVYHLKRSAEAVLVGSDSKCKGVISAGKRLETENLVLGMEYAPPQYLASAPKGGLSRGIFITDRSILPSEKEELTLLQFPPHEGHPEPVTIIELGSATSACPPGLYVMHMTCKQQQNAKEDLMPVVKKLLRTDFEDDAWSGKAETGEQGTQTSEEEGGEADASKEVAKPRVLWSMFFNSPETSSFDLAADAPANVFLCSGPDYDLDFEFAVKQAKDIFEKMYPGCEFLPRAPDPEEIVVDDGGEGEPGPAFGEGEGGEGGGSGKPEGAAGDGGEEAATPADGAAEE
ncbi:rab proteins geranylgeranyltransferase component A [Ischnura elegans]|uniref:rab proteins geranylgeranyltransferase component A n=1 Tax=Ischnura elegans TaxID=197161 RepID=UPI001ED89C67|nr:rab proteins geranylgeranyltransferase component A [Ischnura elegans]